MKRLIHSVLIVWIISSLACGDALARGGRGGGGGGGRGGGGFSGGGGGRPSVGGGHSPSMSRPSTPSASRPTAGGGSRPAAKAGGGASLPKPSAGAGATRPTPGSGRPSASQLTNFLDLPGGGGVGDRAAGAGGRPAGGNAAVADFLGGKGAGGAGDRTGPRAPTPGTRDAAGDRRGTAAANVGTRQDARVANREGMRSNLSDNRQQRRTERQDQLGQRADSVRDQLRDQYDHDHLFDNFWDNNPGAHYRFHQNPLFWSWATFATISAFMPWNWGSPAYYDYGSGGNVAYEDGMVQANGETYTEEEYAQQAADLAASAPAEPVADPEWLPLGVFALTQDSESAPLPNMFLQLAVSKEGIIAGTYQNKTTGKTESIEGMVDKKTQRAAWTVVGKNTPIMETGLANLTLNEAQSLVHFADGQTQQWLLVRIEKPADEQK